MPRFVRHLGLLCAVVALCRPAAAWADTARAQLALPKGSQVQLAVLRDGFSVGLLLEHMDAHAAQAALAPLHAQSMTAQPFGPHGLLVPLQFCFPDRPRRLLPWSKSPKSLTLSRHI